MSFADALHTTNAPAAGASPASNRRSKLHAALACSWRRPG